MLLSTVDLNYYIVGRHPEHESAPFFQRTYADLRDRYGPRNNLLDAGSLQNAALHYRTASIGYSSRVMEAEEMDFIVALPTM